MAAKIRIRYAKHYELRYISHLELARSLERACRRAELPIALSEGFNPHLKLVFATTLPVGVSSCTEYLDMTMSQDLGPEAIAHNLAEFLPAGLSVLGSSVVAPGSSSLQSLDSFFGFMITGAPGDKLLSAANSLRELSELPVKRKKADAVLPDPGRFIRQLELVQAGDLSPYCSCGRHLAPEDSALWIKVFAPGLGGGLKIGDILSFLAEVTAANVPPVAQRTLLSVVRDNAESSPI